MNDDLKEVHEMVEIVKIDPETTISCVRLMEKINMSKAEGMDVGKAEGKAEQLIHQVCKKMKKNKTLAEIAEELEDEVSAIEPIYNIAKAFAPGYDPKLLVFERFLRETEVEKARV